MTAYLWHASILKPESLSNHLRYRMMCSFRAVWCNLDFLFTKFFNQSHSRRCLNAFS